MLSHLIGSTRPRRCPGWTKDTGTGSTPINPNVRGVSAIHRPQWTGETVPFPGTTGAVEYGPEDEGSDVLCTSIHGRRTSRRKQLTDEQIREILSLRGKVSVKEIALRYRVSYGYAQSLTSGKGRAAKLCA